MAWRFLFFFLFSFFGCFLAVPALSVNHYPNSISLEEFNCSPVRDRLKQKLKKSPYGLLLKYGPIKDRLTGQSSNEQQDIHNGKESLRSFGSCRLIGSIPYFNEVQQFLYAADALSLKKLFSERYHTLSHYYLHLYPFFWFW